MRTASIWLLPVDDDRARRLDRVMRRVAGALDGPVFTPHLTVAGALELGPEEMGRVRSRLRRHWSDVGPVEARFGSLTTSADRFRAAVLPVEPAPWVDDLRRVLADDLGIDGLDAPHVSLAYVVPEPSADRIRALVGDLPATIGFDRIAHVPHERGGTDFRPEPL